MEALTSFMTACYPGVLWAAGPFGIPMWLITRAVAKRQSRTATVVALSLFTATALWFPCLALGLWAYLPVIKSNGPMGMAIFVVPYALASLPIAIWLTYKARARVVPAAEQG